MKLTRHDILKIDPKDPDGFRKLLTAYNDFVEGVARNYEEIERSQQEAQPTYIRINRTSTSSSGTPVSSPQVLGDSGTIDVIGSATDAVVPLNKVAPNALYEIHIYLITADGYGSVTPKIPPFAADSRTLNQFLYDRDQTGTLKWFVFYKP